MSATTPQDVVELTHELMRDPVRILVKKDKIVLEGINQFYVAVEEDRKLDTLNDLCKTIVMTQAVIFCNTRRQLEWLFDKLTSHDFDFDISAMHGDMAATQRALIMEQFRSRSSRVLMATNLLARGIDLQWVPLVINYDLPASENYVHRVGRGGRFGRRGVAINFVTAEDIDRMHDIEKIYSTQIEELPKNITTLGVI